MRSKSNGRKNDGPPPSDDVSPDESPPNRDADQHDVPTEDDEFSDLDDSNLQDADDDRWDVFILDDDETDPLPEYGDFWFPD